MPSRDKFSSINSYKRECLETLENLGIGDSIKIEDRTLDTVKTTWLWRVERKTGFKKLDKTKRKPLVPPQERGNILVKIK